MAQMLEVDSMSDEYDFNQKKLTYEWLEAGIKKYGSSHVFYNEMVKLGILKRIDGFCTGIYANENLTVKQ